MNYLFQIRRRRRRRICESSVSRHLQRFFPLLAMAGWTRPTLSLIGLPWGRRAVSYFLYAREKNYKYAVSFERTDKNKVSFESAKGLLLFLYSHNNNEMCFINVYTYSNPKPTTYSRVPQIFPWRANLPQSLVPTLIKLTYL